MQLNIDDFFNLKMTVLLGNPVKHSFSPRMQNAAYKFLNLNMLYTLCETESEKLEYIVNGIKYMSNYAGFALTTPNKIEVMQYLDDYDDLCKKIGSANTVVKEIKNNKLIGYNTDGYGALRDISEKGVEIKNKKIFSFGAGGTAWSVCFELANAGAEKIYICSRSESCENLSENINKFFDKKCTPINTYDLAGVKNALDECEIILNLTGAGMTGKENLTCVNKDFLRPDHICFDATYNPEKTRFLIEAAEKGCEIINGLGMILYQGARQIELWSGINIFDNDKNKKVIDIMRDELKSFIVV